MTDSRHLTVTRRSTLDSIRKLQPEWADLCQQQPHATPFQRPEWLFPWMECFQPQDLWVLEVRAYGTLVGIAPLFAYNSNDERILGIVGAGISDYLDFIVDPNHAEEVLHAIFAFLQHTAAECDRIELLDLSHHSPILSSVPGNAWQMETAEHDVCPRLILPSGISELRQFTRSSQHRNLRTAMNRIRRTGRVQVTVADQATLSEHLEALFSLHRARWQESGKPGVLTGEVVKEFHRRAAPLLLEARLLRLYALRLNNDPIAALYTLWGPDAVYLYLQGFDLVYAEFSPGMQIIAAVLEDALRHGTKIVDFLRGREAYKYGWGARDQATFRRILRRSKEGKAVIPQAEPLRLAS